jgi:hypothetical protein
MLFYKNDKAFACGVVDGFYINIADKVANITQLVTCLKQLVNPVDFNKSACEAIGEQLYEPLKMIYGLVTSSENRSQAWKGMKEGLSNFGDLLECTGTYSDKALCNYMQGRLIGDFVADFSSGVASVKLLKTVKDVATITNFTTALNTIAAVENGFASVKKIVNKIPNAILQKVGTGANLTAKLIVNGSIELLSYTQKVIKVPASRWISSTSG